MIAMVGLVTKKSETCYLCCVACGRYMEGKKCKKLLEAEKIALTDL